MDYVNYNGPNCLHKFACIPHYFCKLEFISSIFHKYIFYNRYIINGFQPSQCSGKAPHYDKPSLKVG